MFNYTPGIHGFKVMNDSTRNALQALWDCHPSHPALLQSFISPDTGGRLVGGGLEIVLPHGPNDFTYTPLKKADDLIDRAILRNAVFEVMSDEWLQDFPLEFQNKTAAFSMNYRQLCLLIMPGCVFLHFPIWDEACAEMIKDDMCDNHFDMWNLGIFAAGPTGSAHEKIHAQGLVEKSRATWSRLIAAVNEYEHTRVRILDPEIHPGEEGYCGL